MVFLLDTSTFSDLMRGRGPLEARMGNLPPTDRVIICSIVRGEVLYGIERMPSGKRREAVERNAIEMFDFIPCEPVTPQMADRYSQLKSELERRGLRLDENDLWIAATAMALSATLVTRDSDFQRIAGLSVEDWTA